MILITTTTDAEEARASLSSVFALSREGNSAARCVRYPHRKLNTGGRTHSNNGAVTHVAPWGGARGGSNIIIPPELSSSSSSIFRR